MMNMRALENCPLCGSKVEEGFLYGRSPFQWSKERRRFTDGMENIVSGPYSLGATSVKAYRCNNCKMVLFFYEENKSEEGRE